MSDSIYEGINDVHHFTTDNATNFAKDVNEWLERGYRILHVGQESLRDGDDRL